MTWDLRLNLGTRDLEPGIVTGADEVVQRLLTRLKRELGEWFLNTSAGLPWYQDGKGILGSKSHTRRAVDLLIRRETLDTKGVERIVRLNTLFLAGGRDYSIFMEVFITGIGIVSISLKGEDNGQKWS